MHNEQLNTPKRRGHGPGMGAGEKAKNFKSAIQRLIIELKPFRVLVILSLMLASLGSILSIVAPDKLSLLTDKISDGLVVNQEHLETLTQNIMRK